MKYIERERQMGKGSIMGRSLCPYAGSDLNAAKVDKEGNRKEEEEEPPPPNS